MKHLIFIISLLSFQQNVVGQKNVGFNLGPTAGRFMNLSKDDKYETKYAIKSGAAIQFYYETKEDSITYLRYGLQYQYQQAHLEVDGYEGQNYSSYENVNYQFQQVRLSIGYGIQATPTKKVDTRILFGLWASYNFSAHIKGSARYYENSTVTEEEVNRFDASSMAPFGFGANLGWSMAFPMNDKMSFLLQNEYYMNINHVPRRKGIKRYTTLLTGVLEFGFSYTL